MCIKFESFSEGDTYSFAYKLGKNAEQGQIICMDGDLGAGKTVFAKGFAAGLGIDEPITSPTFNIVKEYESGRLKLYHFDAYRIEDPDEMFAIGFDEYLNSDGVCLIEWASLISELIPNYAHHLTITRNVEDKGENYRMLCYN